MEFNILNKNNISIIDNKDIIYYMTPIINNLFAVNFKHKVIIYDSLLYCIKYIIDCKKYRVYYILLLKDNTLITSSYNAIINLYKLNSETNSYECFQTIKDHYFLTVKLIQLENENIFSISLDKSLMAYKKNDDNKYHYFFKMVITQKIYNVIEIKSNILCITSKNSVYFLDLNQQIIFNKIENVNLNEFLTNNMIIINNILIIGGFGIYLIDINNYNFIKKVEIENNNCIHCILKINNKIFLTGDLNCNIKQYNLINNEIQLKYTKSNVHKKCIRNLIKINKKIISGGVDCLIKIWE